jgi:hypothetical protein
MAEVPGRDDICPHCGEQIPQIVNQELVIKDLLKQLGKSKATIEGMRNDRRAGLKSDPFYEDSLEVFEHWRERLMPGAREFSQDRAKAVMARLRAGATTDDLKKAIDGCARKPYVTEKGRSADGLPSERYADLELICRSERHVMQFQAYADDPGGSASDGPSRPAPAPPASGSRIVELLYGGSRPVPYERALAVLAMEFGHDTIINFGGRASRREFYAVCPAHDARTHPPTLAVWEKDRIEGNSLEFRCDNGCLPSQIHTRLQDLEAAQAGRVAHDDVFRRMAYLLAAFDPLTLTELVAQVAAPKEAVAA